MLLLLISFLRQFPNLLGSGRPGDHSSGKLNLRDTAQNSLLCLSLLIKPASSSSFSSCLFYNTECLGDMPISSIWILNGDRMNYKWHGIYLHSGHAEGGTVLYRLSRHIGVNRWESLLVDKFKNCCGYHLGLHGTQYRGAEWKVWNQEGWRKWCCQEREGGMVPTGPETAGMENKAQRLQG